MNVVEGPFAEIKARWEKEVEAEDSHGLVGRKPDGTQVKALPGHSFGKAEVEALIKDTLAAK
jgi:hypothetical protein